jgi:hypothetical protein
MDTFSPLHADDTARWALLTCPRHRAGDVELRQQGAFTEVRCRECAREAGASGETSAR